MNITVDKDLLPQRIAEIHSLGEELIEIKTAVIDLPFNISGQRSHGPHAAAMRSFQDTLLQVINCEKELIDAVETYLNSSLQTFETADSQ